LNALVTGGAGFIGSHLTERLVSEGGAGVCVRVVDNLRTGKRENLKSVLGRIEFVEGDLLEAEVRERAVRDVEVVFHLADLPSVPNSVRRPVESHYQGVHTTLLLLDACRRRRMRRVIFASSSSVYGDDPELPKREEMLPQPLSPYAASKLASEAYLSAFAHCYDMETISLRYFNIFGPRQDPNSPYSGVIALYCLAFLSGRPFTLCGDGRQSRDFTYVANVAEANWLAARARGPFRGEAFNVACGRRQTLNRMIRALNQLTGQNRAPRRAPPRPGDVRHSQADLTRIAERLGYRPVVDFRRGLQLTLEWYRARRGR
jgi:UDP-glucose 4-epimerase